MMEAKLKHLEMIQGVINRMASNSFLFKGWSITIIAAISAFASKDNNPMMMTIPVVSTLLFWAVDAYYLMMERAFRKLYDEVAEMDTKTVDFKMNIVNKGIKFNDWFTTLKRSVLVLFYGTVFVMMIVLIFILNNFNLEVNITYGA